MVREWVQRFLADARAGREAAGRPGMTNFERSYEAAATYLHTYRSKLPEIVSVTQLAMVNDDFASYWTDLCSLPIELIMAMVKRAQRDGYCQGDDPKLVAIALLSMLNGFCYYQFSGDGRADAVDEKACINTLANVFYRAIYHEGAKPA
jgi:AcrR family transcriptional regulator